MLAEVLTVAIPAAATVIITLVTVLWSAAGVKKELKADLKAHEDRCAEDRKAVGRRLDRADAKLDRITRSLPRRWIRGLP